MGLFGNIINSIKSIKRDTFIKNSFLMPILFVVAMSISHVISWYDIGNPFAWAIYLSVAIEVFALASVSAASINIGRASVWFLFILVTAIQITGNIFFEFTDIDEKGKLFLSWVELVKPFFEDWTLTDHRRLLAIIQGGTIPMMSLVALNYYIKFEDKLKEREKPVEATKEEKVEEVPIKEESKEINTVDEGDSIAPFASNHE